MDARGIIRWAEDQALRGPWAPNYSHPPFLQLNRSRNVYDTEFHVPSGATVYTLAGPASERSGTRLQAGTALEYRGEDCIPIPGSGSHLVEVLEGNLRGRFIFSERGMDPPHLLHPPLSDCPHRVPLRGTDSGQRTVWRYAPEPAAQWEAIGDFIAHDGWPDRDAVAVPAGTHLRLRQADGIWIGIEFDNPGWYHVEIVDGPLRGRCVVVSASWPGYELPSELREWTDGLASHGA